MHKDIIKLKSYNTTLLPPAQPGAKYIWNTKAWTSSSKQIFPVPCQQEDQQRAAHKTRLLFEETVAE